MNSSNGEMNFAPLLQLVDKEAKQAPSALGGDQIQSMLGNTHKKNTLWETTTKLTDTTHMRGYPPLL